MGGAAVAFLLFAFLATAAVAQAPGIDAATLPRDLTPWSMFLNADPLVKAVLIGLTFASVVTWTVWLAKTIELVFTGMRVRTSLRLLAPVRRLAEGVERLAGSAGPVRELVDAAVTEFRVSAGSADRDGIKERIASRLERIEAARGRRMMRGTSVLATIGATAPFVGLFGTVWGIMNSFIGISREHTTNLAVVAPGIAEALFATAIGLIAAIPATIFYNKFISEVNRQAQRLEGFADEFTAILSRQIDERG
jgi:biopolymer transport protein ExbB